MDNCTRCGDVATTRVTTIVLGYYSAEPPRYCNPCSIEVAKLAPPGVQVVFDRAITDAEQRAIYEAGVPGMLHLAPGSVVVE